MKHVRIGLTGGIASGKSYVSALIREHIGILVIDYDLLAAKAYEDESTRAQVLDAFETLDKREIAEVVFASTPKRKLLESILHPKIEELAKVEERAALSISSGISSPSLPPAPPLASTTTPIVSPPLPPATHRSTSIVVHDIPLLFELSMQSQFDGVIAVSTPEEVRIQRLVDTRGYSEEHARARIRSGARDSDRIRIADLTISGVQSADQTIAELTKFFAAF